MRKLPYLFSVIVDFAVALASSSHSIIGIIDRKLTDIYSVDGFS